MSNMNLVSSMAKLEEARQLESVQFRLERALKEADEPLQAYQDDIQSQKEYLWNSLMKWTISRKSLPGNPSSRR